MFFKVLLILFFIAAVICLAFDAVPMAVDFILRRGIGSFSSREQWLEAAHNKLDLWLTKKTPSVPRVAGRRLRVIDYIRGEEKIGSIQAWQTASLLLAAKELGDPCAEEKTQELLKEKSKASSADEAYLIYAILSCDDSDNSALRDYAFSARDMLLESYKANKNLAYSANSAHAFVDAVGMACPFLMKFALRFSDEEAMSAAVEYIRLFSEKGIHEKFGLPVHCFDVNNGAPLGIYGWGRGCGWWGTGLAECFRVLMTTDENSYKSEKLEVLKALILFCREIIKYQCPNGAFDRNVLAFSGEDSSATAMLAYTLAFTGNFTGDKSFAESAQRAFDYLLSVTRKDGTVDYSQADTMGIGFYSGESIVLPSALGFALRAGAELGKQVK